MCFNIFWHGCKYTNSVGNLEKVEKKKRIPNRNSYFTKLSRGNTGTVVQPQVALWPECWLWLWPSVKMPSTTLFLCHFCSVLTSACTSTGFLSFLSGFLSCNCQWGNDYSDNPREVFASLKLDDFRKFYSRGSGEFPQRGSSPYLLPLTVFSVNCENFRNALFIKEINVGGYDAWSEGAVDAATEQPLTRKQHLKKKMDFKSKANFTSGWDNFCVFPGLVTGTSKSAPLRLPFWCDLSCDQTWDLQSQGRQTPKPRWLCLVCAEVSDELRCSNFLWSVPSILKLVTLQIFQITHGSLGKICSDCWDWWE